MFTVIKCENKRNGLKKLFVRRRYYVDTVSEGDLHFLLLTLNDSEKIDWKQIEQILAGKTGNVLLQKGLELPENSALMPPDVKKLRYCLAKNAVEGILKKAAGEQRKNHVLILDKNMQFIDFVSMAVPYCGMITIATYHTKEYADKMGDIGNTKAELIHPEQVAETAEYTMILAPLLTADFATMLTDKQYHCPVICAETEPGATVCGTLMTGFAPELPKAYLEEKPDGIREIEFAAAIYSCMEPEVFDSMPPKHCDIYLDGKLAAKQVSF